MYLKEKVKSWMLVIIVLSMTVGVCYGAWMLINYGIDTISNAQPHTQVCITIWLSAWTLGLMLSGDRNITVTTNKDDEQ